MRHTLIVDSVRVDTWLWAVRIYKTRSLATTACRGGLVTVNDRAAKASTVVKPGDVVQARAGDRQRILEVVTVLSKRVGAPVAAAALIDRSPPPPRRDDVATAPVFTRDRGQGRPTKRDRREMERLRRRDGGE